MSLIDPSEFFFYKKPTESTEAERLSEFLRSAAESCTSRIDYRQLISETLASVKEQNPKRSLAVLKSLLLHKGLKPPKDEINCINDLIDILTAEHRWLIHSQSDVSQSLHYQRYNPERGFLGRVKKQDVTIGENTKEIDVNKSTENKTVTTASSSLMNRILERERKRRKTDKVVSSMNSAMTEETSTTSEPIELENSTVEQTSTKREGDHNRDDDEERTTGEEQTLIPNITQRTCQGLLCHSGKKRNLAHSNTFNCCHLNQENFNQNDQGIEQIEKCLKDMSDKVDKENSIESSGSEELSSNKTQMTHTSESDSPKSDCYIPHDSIMDLPSVTSNVTTEHPVRYCRQCKFECPQPTRSFCSSGCLHLYKLRSGSSYVRSSLLCKDKGVCQLCYLDCEKLRCALNKRIGKIGGSPAVKLNLAINIAQQLGSPCPDKLRVNRRGLLTRGSFFHCDHILAVSEGGGNCLLENFRILCIRCHRDVTANLRKNRKGMDAGKQKRSKTNKNEMTSSLIDRKQGHQNEKENDEKIVFKNKHQGKGLERNSVGEESSQEDTDTLFCESSKEGTLSSETESNNVNKKNRKQRTKHPKVGRWYRKGFRR